MPGLGLACCPWLILQGVKHVNLMSASKCVFVAKASEVSTHLPLEEEWELLRDHHFGPWPSGLRCCLSHFLCPFPDGWHFLALSQT